MKFDQDHSGGWRGIAGQGCELTAAMPIDNYNLDAPADLTVNQREDLCFHAGQLYAMVGLNDLAVRRMMRSLNLHEPTDIDLAWNTYVLATVAFLQSDREELSHRRQLLANAKPSRENRINLSAVNGLVRCFDKPYKYA